MKKFYQENRVFVILMGIVLACFIIIGIFLLKYFYFGNGTSKYGDRLDGIDKVKISAKQETNYGKLIAEYPKVNKATVRVSGKIIYVSIFITNDATLIDGQNISVKSLELFSEAEKGFYEFQYLLKNEDKENGFVISGNKPISGTTIVWNNNTEVEEDSNEE